MKHPATNRLECLDGLRGVLAVYVMIGHMAPFSALPGWMIRPLSHGGAAVDVFFMLSGLVIFRSLESCGFQARPFLIARATRIFPVFLVMFAAGVAVQPLPVTFSAMPWIGPDSIARDIWSQGWPAYWEMEIAAHLTMTHGLFPAAVLPDVWVSFLGAAWSLSTEWQFYVLALVFGRTGLGMTRMAGVFLVLACAGLVWDLMAPDAWRFSRAFLPNKAHYFALGIASASLTAGRSPRLFGGVLLTVLALSAAHGGLGKSLPPLVWAACLAVQLVQPAEGPGSRTFPGLIRRIGACLAAPLRWRGVQYLGAISYPIYLANEPIQKVLGVGLARLSGGDGIWFTAVWLPAAILAPLAAAAVLHRYVEAPALRWGRALAHHGVTTIGVRS